MLLGESESGKMREKAKSFLLDWMKIRGKKYPREDRVWRRKLLG